jgi:thioredoxin-related protein
MTYILKHCVHIILTVVFILSGTLYAQDTIWHDNLEAARITALAAQKDILLYFSQSDKNRQCQQLEAEVFEKELFKKEAPQRYILVQVDFSNAEAMSEADKRQKGRIRAEYTRKYGLSGYPTIYLMDPNSEVYAQTGYQKGGAQAYLDHLRLLSMTKPIIDPGSQWLAYIETAMAKAAYHKKDLLMLFTGSDWCPPCKMLEREILSTSIFKEGITRDFVLVKFDYPRSKSQPEALKKQNQYMQDLYAKKYQFAGYPTIYLADARGNPYAKVGYSKISPQE